MTPEQICVYAAFAVFVLLFLLALRQQRAERTAGGAGTAGILSDTAILAAVEAGDLEISGFDRRFLGSNSYDVHLGRTLAVYVDSELDCRKENRVEYFDIPAEGYVLQPGCLYLGVTVERTYVPKHMPCLEGKSSTGRLGIGIHVTAGKGDVGYDGYWTMEITVTQPTRVYAGMPVGQLILHTVAGEVETPYNRKPCANYNNDAPKPVPSRLYNNWEQKIVEVP